MADNITPYSEVFDAALSKLRDYDLAELTQDECYAILHDYLRPACVKFKVCKQNLSNRDSLLYCFNVALSDDEIEILSNEVVTAYLYATYIKTPLVLKTVLPSRDFSTFSNANHLEKLLQLHGTLKRENEQLMSSYSWSNSSVFSGGD
jgi:hypothetical protein